MPGYVVACLITFYILQKRELKSFIRERNATIKQEQVTQIFNAQSDAIVVVKQPDSVLKGDTEAATADIEVLYSNERSHKLLQSSFKDIKN